MPRMPAAHILSAISCAALRRAAAFLLVCLLSGGVFLSVDAQARDALLARGGLYYKLYKLQYEHGLEPVEV